MLIESSELRSVVDQTGGIGTPATRADIIEKLFSDQFYVERRGKEIFPLSKGMQLVELVPEDLHSPPSSPPGGSSGSARSAAAGSRSAAFVERDASSTPPGWCASVIASGRGPTATTT